MREQQLTFLAVDTIPAFDTFADVAALIVA